MEYTKVERLVSQCDKLISDFSKKTESYPIDIAENKTSVMWSLTYNLIKIQFLFTKKEKLMCPTTTLFCRIFLGKNDDMYFHVPELVHHLDSGDYKCYYFPYIESEERLEACFEELEQFLCKHFPKLNQIALDEELVSNIKSDKMNEIIKLCDIKEKDQTPEVFAYWIAGYEKYVLLPRYTADGAYRDFLKGDYKKSKKRYEKMAEKNKMTAYEERVRNFMSTLEQPYEAISERCASVIEMEKYSGPNAEGLMILKGVFFLELCFGSVFSILLFVLNQLFSAGSLLYYGIEWYWGFLLGVLPSLFGSIALRRSIAKILYKKQYKKAMDYDELVNTKGVNKLYKISFVLASVACIIMGLSLISYDTTFYEDRVRFSIGEGLVSLQKMTCYYEELEEVIYSEGVYNDYGDYIDRPSYLLLFKNGVVWDSDSCTSVEEVESKILKLLEPYAGKVRSIEARNEYID